MTTNRKSLSGATIISCFFDRTLKNVKSLPGSKSRTALLALSANWLIRPAYWTVVVLSNVLFTGMPIRKTSTSNVCSINQIDECLVFDQYERIYNTHWLCVFFSCWNQWDHSPSLLTTIVPTTPLCEAIRFNVSSTSCDWNRFYKRKTYVAEN